MIVHGAEVDTGRAGVPAGVRRFTVRTGLALGALATARFVPFLGLVMALIGDIPLMLQGVVESVRITFRNRRQCCLLDGRQLPDDWG